MRSPFSFCLLKEYALTGTLYGLLLSFTPLAPYSSIFLSASVVSDVLFFRHHLQEEERKEKIQERQQTKEPQGCPASSGASRPSTSGAGICELKKRSQAPSCGRGGLVLCSLCRIL